MTSNAQETQTQHVCMDDIVGQEFKVLDHGFVRVVDYMGSDEAVVQAARVSYGKGTKKLSQDRGLIRYLMRHRHSTPFEMCELKLHVKLPIFVARQWIRHRTANVNEYSARYSILDKEFYVPDRDYLLDHNDGRRATNRLSKLSAGGQDDLFGLTQTDSKEVLAVGPQSISNKQGREIGMDTAEVVDHLASISNISSRAYTAYERLLNETSEGKELNSERIGLARELARMVLPTNYYTQWYWKIDLHNLLHFISLRADHHAQYEIREYARMISEIVRLWAPLTWEAFSDYHLGGATLSAMELKLLRTLLKGGDLDYSSSGLSKREWKEFTEKFELVDATSSS